MKAGRWKVLSPASGDRLSRYRVARVILDDDGTPSHVEVKEYANSYSEAERLAKAAGIDCT
jgi:hypothetical protein